MQLASHEVHWWCVNLDVPAETSAGFFGTLSPDERDRSTCYRFDRDRRRYIVAHGILRELLGRYLETRPGYLRFEHNAFAKPELSPVFGGRLRFNLSYSADLALIAVAAHAHVGIDLEHIEPQPEYPDIARHFFTTAEVEQLNKLPDHLHAEAFLTYWTRKEAYVKACGQGFAIPLTNLPPEGWSLYSLRPAPGYVAALAVEGSAWQLRQWHW